MIGLYQLCTQRRAISEIISQFFPFISRAVMIYHNVNNRDTLSDDKYVDTFFRIIIHFVDFNIVNFLSKLTVM